MSQILSFNLGLPEQPETNNNELYNELIKIYGAVRSLAYILDSYTGALPLDESSPNSLALSESHRSNRVQKLYLEATENISFGHVVKFVTSGPEVKIAKAVNTDGITGYVVAYCSALTGITSGTKGEITMGPCLHPFFTGLTPGSVYYLSEGPGLLTATVPTVPGRLIQPVGICLKADTLFFNPKLYDLELVP